MRDTLVSAGQNTAYFIRSHARSLSTLLVIVATFAIGMNWVNGNSSQSSNQLSATGGLVDSRNFSYLQGDELLAYNGLAFYSTNVKTGQRKFLYSGTKLPAISSLAWAGTNGVAMVFKENFFGTPINGLLEQNGQKVDNTTKDYTWYLNFKTSSITQISQNAIDADKAIYDPSNKTLYYSELSSGSSDGDKVRFYSYDTTKQTSPTLLLDDAGVADVSSLAKCSRSKLVCFIAHDTASTSGQQVFAIQAGKLGKVSLLDGGSDGQVYYGGHKDYYVVTSPSANGTTESSVLYDVSTEQSKAYRLGFTFDDDTHSYFASAKDFYVVDGKTTSGFKAAKLKGSSSTTKDRGLKLNEETYDGALGDIRSSEGKAISLVSNTDGRQYLFGPEPITTMSSFAKKETVQLAVSDCGRRTTTRNQYNDKTRTFTIKILALYGFAKQIKDFGSCMTKDHVDSVHGYYFNFVGLNTDDSVVAE